MRVAPNILTTPMRQGAILRVPPVSTRIRPPGSLDPDGPDAPVAAPQPLPLITVRRQNSRGSAKPTQIDARYPQLNLVQPGIGNVIVNDEVRPLYRVQPTSPGKREWTIPLRDASERSRGVDVEITQQAPVRNESTGNDLHWSVTKISRDPSRPNTNRTKIAVDPKSTWDAKALQLGDQAIVLRPTLEDKNFQSAPFVAKPDGDDLLVAFIKPDEFRAMRAHPERALAFLQEHFSEPAQEPESPGAIVAYETPLSHPHIAALATMVNDDQEIALFVQLSTVYAILQGALISVGTPDQIVKSLNLGANPTAFEETLAPVIEDNLPIDATLIAEARAHGDLRYLHLLHRLKADGVTDPEHRNYLITRAPTPLYRFDIDTPAYRAALELFRVYQPEGFDPEAAELAKGKGFSASDGAWLRHYTTSPDEVDLFQSVDTVIDLLDDMPAKKNLAVLLRKFAEEGSNLRVRYPSFWQNGFLNLLDEILTMPFDPVATANALLNLYELMIYQLYAGDELNDTQAEPLVSLIASARRTQFLIECDLGTTLQDLAIGAIPPAFVPSAIAFLRQGAASPLNGQIAAFLDNDVNLDAIIKNYPAGIQLFKDIVVGKYPPEVAPLLLAILQRSEHYRADKAAWQVFTQTVETLGNDPEIAALVMPFLNIILNPTSRN